MIRTWPSDSFSAAARAFWVSNALCVESHTVNWSPSQLATDANDSIGEWISTLVR